MKEAVSLYHSGYGCRFLRQYLSVDDHRVPGTRTTVVPM